MARVFCQNDLDDELNFQIDLISCVDALAAVDTHKVCFSDDPGDVPRLDDGGSSDDSKNSAASTVMSVSSPREKCEVGTTRSFLQTSTFH